MLPGQRIGGFDGHCLGRKRESVIIARRRVELVGISASAWSSAESADCSIVKIT